MGSWGVVSRWGVVDSFGPSTFFPFDRSSMIKSSLFQIFFACILFGRLSQ